MKEEEGSETQEERTVSGEEDIPPVSHGNNDNDRDNGPSRTARKNSREEQKKDKRNLSKGIAPHEISSSNSSLSSSTNEPLEDSSYNLDEHRRRNSRKMGQHSASCPVCGKMWKRSVSAFICPLCQQDSYLRCTNCALFIPMHNMIACIHC